MSSDPDLGGDFRARDQMAVEVFKQVVEERRFVMVSYMRALGLYLALAGFGLKSLIEARPFLLVAVLGILSTAFNALAIYAAGRFRSMALHTIERERSLCSELRIQEPHPLLWGYTSGIVVVILVEVAVVVFVSLAFNPREFSL